MPAPEVLHTVAELAASWRVSKNYIYDLIARGELESVNLGHGRAKTRIPEAAATAFRAARTSPTSRQRTSLRVVA